jgi:hypothetical protein
MGASPIKLNILAAGGRGPQGDGDVHDFSYDTAITFNPGDSHAYEGNLFLSDIGHYHFFISYQTPDGQWSTSVPTEGLATNTLDIDVGPLPDRIVANICSPGELRVYDSDGRVTGLVSGEVREEIPSSLYYDGISVILSPLDSYAYEVVGTDDGTYGLDIISVEDGKATMFSRTNTPIVPASVHEYSVDWDALSQGGEGVTVRIDADGDGTFEETTTIRPPVPFFTYSPENPGADVELTFDASESYDADGAIISYEWDFGDGYASSGKVVTHTYSTVGEYAIRLTLTDEDGMLSTYSKVIRVGKKEQRLPTWAWIGIAVIAALAAAFAVWHRMVKRQAPKA